MGHRVTWELLRTQRLNLGSLVPGMFKFLFLCLKLFKYLTKLGQSEAQVYPTSGPKIEKFHEFDNNWVVQIK